MNYLHLHHPFFLPLWRRVLVTAALFCWAAIDLALGNPLFGVLVGALALYCFYHLFWRFDPKAFTEQDPE